MTLGKHGAITCEQARDLARQALAAVARGEDPQGDKFRQREAERMGDLWERFASEQLSLKKGSTATEYQRQWDTILEPLLGNRLVKEVTRSDIERLHKKMRDTPYRANRVLALVSRLMNLAEAWSMRENGSNPCRHVERFLSVAEIRQLIAALTEMVDEGEIGPDAARAIRLLLLTGARLNEVPTEWAWVDLERRVISLPDSKTGKKPIF